VYRWWATWVFLAIIAQIGLAGVGAFYAGHKTDNGGVVNSDTFDHGFGPHIFWGYFGVGLSIIIFVVIGLIAGIGKWRLGRQGILFLLFVLQVILAGVGFSFPALGFLHPINALVIFTLAGSIVYTSWRDARAPAPEPAASAPVPEASAAE